MIYKFSKVADENNPYDNSHIEHTVNSVSLPDLINEFENFLRGCGFIFDGHLTIEDEEQDEV